MKHINVIQGSPEWLALRKDFFTASEAPMMMGAHKNISRNQLLDAKKGWTTIVDDFLQSLFDKGHATEEAARPLAAVDVGEDLFPVTGSLEVEGLPLLASFDGLTMFDDVCFEHKLFNKTLAENVLNNLLEPHYYWQVEQQLLVSGADKCYFVTSDGTKESWQSMYYVSVPERREELIKGWKQFDIDLENHEPQAKVEKVVSTTPVRDLPAINYKMNGLALESNLKAYKQAATDLVALSEKALESDQDFADAEARQKVFTKAEKDIKDACDRVMGEIDSIDTFVKDMRFISEQIRQARLAEGKQIKARKEELRKEILEKANAEIGKVERAAEQKVNAPLPHCNFDPFIAMKGKRTIESLQDAADGEVAKAKIKTAEFVEVAMGNALHLSTKAQGYDFLFNDWAQIAFKPTEDFKTLVTARVATYQAEQKAKEEAERERIRQEEQAKLQREAEAKARAEREAEAQKKREEQAKRDAEEQARFDVEDHESLHNEAERLTEYVNRESNKRNAAETNQIAQEPKGNEQAEESKQKAEPAPSVVRQEQNPVRHYGLMELNAMDQLAKLVEEANKPYANDLRQFVESVKANNLKKVA
jgi:hypothetical protein